MKKYFVVVILILTSFTFSSCKKTKDTGCFSKGLQDASRNLFCTADCPGVVGCDGLMYCNACEAAIKGISVP